MKPTRQNLIDSIKSHYEFFGVAPKKVEALKSAKFLYPRRRYIEEFGTWNKAILASGIGIAKFSVACDYYEITSCSEDGCNNSFKKEGNTKRCDVCREKDKNKECVNCGQPNKRTRSEFCSWDCRTIHTMKNETVGDLSRYSEQNKYRAIRDKAHGLYKKDATSCQNCGYDKHVEICHITPIRDFDVNSSVWEVNCPSNILILCPNCHWEFDYGDLTLDDILS